MALKETIRNIKDLLGQITMDLDKAEWGNKAAAQRVRTGTVRLEKIAKVYRKESINDERGSRGTRSKKGGSSRSKTADRMGAKMGSKGKTNSKSRTGKATASARALSFKRASAKLPTKKSRAFF